MICFDRNFPGYDLITAILAAGRHVVARVKAGISLPMEPGGGWLPDGSCLTWLTAAQLVRACGDASRAWCRP